MIHEQWLAVEDTQAPVVFGGFSDLQTSRSKQQDNETLRCNGGTDHKAYDLCLLPSAPQGEGLDGDPFNYISDVCWEAGSVCLVCWSLC